MKEPEEQVTDIKSNDKTWEEGEEIQADLLNVFRGHMTVRSPY